MLLILENLNSFLFALAVLAIGVWVRGIIFPPFDFPKNIPTIPFYVCFVPILTNWDQEKIYRKFYRDKLEKYGIVKMFFASRWNILVSKPEYVLEVIRQDLVFEKSGNQEKIPYSVLSEYLGDNLISAGNENWVKYRRVAEDSIKFPDTVPLDGHVKDLVIEIKNNRDKNGIVCVNDIFQRFTLACVGDCILGCDLKSKDCSESTHEKIMFLKKKIFQPLYMNFTFLDSFPIPSRVRARKAVTDFKSYITNKIQSERTNENTKKLGSRLAASYEAGEITKKQFQDNAVIAIVAGHENPQILLTTVIFFLAKFQNVQKELKAEIEKLSIDDQENCALLNAVVYESLRLYPPIAQLVNKITREEVLLGGKFKIPKNVYIGYNSMFTQRDSNYWKDADEFRPERWGTSPEEIALNYRKAKSNCTFIAFHGRKRACLGQQFALLEVKKAVISIMKSFEFTLDPKWVPRITQSGPMWPVNLSIKFKIVESARNTDVANRSRL